MSTDESTPSLFERILAYATAAIMLVAILSFFATLIVGLSNSEALAEGLWPFVYGLSLFGLPIGFALLIILLVVAQRRRSREAKQAAAARGPQNAKQKPSKGAKQKRTKR